MAVPAPRMRAPRAQAAKLWVAAIQAMAAAWAHTPAAMSHLRPSRSASAPGTSWPVVASALTAAEKNKAIPAAQDAITRAKQAVAAARTARDAIPAKIAVNQAHPGAQRALLSACRRGLQMVLRLLAANAELWLAGRLNAYLRDLDEYRPSPATCSTSPATSPTTTT